MKIIKKTDFVCNFSVELCFFLTLKIYLFLKNDVKYLYENSIPNTFIPVILLHITI